MIHPGLLLETLDRHLPLGVRQLLAELPVNRLLLSGDRAGQLEPLANRRIRLQLAGSEWGLTLAFWEGRLRYLEGPGEVTIEGTPEAFLKLLQRRQDPDQLFFRRELLITGDTELGLAVKNLLDSLEWEPRDLLPSPLAGLLR